MKKTRNASFELLRIICMFMIVYYHLFVKIDYISVIQSPVYSTILYPLHIAVVCFVLISGYFRIKLSCHKLLNFLIQVLFYNVLAYGIYVFLSGEFTIKDFLFSFLPFSHNQDLWFVRTYLMLMLISPILNKYLDSTPPEKISMMFTILIFISMYLGTFGNDPSLKEGKNITNFMTIYFLGNEFRYKRLVPNISKKNILLILILFNFFFVSVVYFGYGTIFVSKLRIISWDYNSPLLIFNAGLFFLLFEKISFSSSVVLKIATSVFPIYLIHSNLQIQRFLWPSLQKLSDSDPLWIKYTFISIMIMMVCIALDKLFAPIYNAIAKNIYRLFEKYSFCKII